MDFGDQREMRGVVLKQYFAGGVVVQHDGVGVVFLGNGLYLNGTVCAKGAARKQYEEKRGKVFHAVPFDTGCVLLVVDILWRILDTRALYTLKPHDLSWRHEWIILVEKELEATCNPFCMDFLVDTVINVDLQSW